MPYFRTERITRASKTPDRSIAIVEERGDSVVLVAASAKALAAGVRPGMTAAAARTLAPALEMTALNPAGEAGDFESLAAVLYRFTPRVYLDAPNALLLDITGCERLFGDATLLTGELIAAVKRLGYTTATGLADSPTAAYALALDGRADGDVNGASVRALRLEDSDVEHLEALGVRTVGGLLALPLETLPARFSELLLTRMRELRGDAIEEFPVFRPLDILQERLDFTGPTDRHDVLMFALRRVAAALEERLAALGAGALLLEVRLLAHEGAPISFSIPLSRPARDSRSLAALLLGRFENVDTDERWFEGVDVRVPSLGSITPPQRDLFGKRDPAREHSFVELLDELTCRLGVEAIARAKLTSDPRPEHSYTFRAFTAAIESSPAPPAPRPFTTFDPHEVEVECDEAGRPVRWHNGTSASGLMPVAGPERVSFGWWDGDGAERDYYVLEDDLGARWRVERRKNRWFIVGAY